MSELDQPIEVCPELNHEAETQAHWNTYNENFVKRIAENMILFKWSHILQANRKSRVNNVSMYLIIATGPLISLLAQIRIQTSDNQTMSTVLGIVVTFLGFFLSTMTAILKFGNFEKVANDHKNAAAKYVTLTQTIRQELSLTRAERTQQNIFVEKIMAEYAQIFTNSPQLRQKIQSVYNETGQLNKSVPQNIEVDNLFFDDPVAVNV